MIEGLNKAIEIIEKEKEYASSINPQMAMGMLRVSELIRQEIYKEQNK